MRRILAILFVLVLLAGGGYYWWSRRLPATGDATAAAPTQSPSPSPVTVRAEQLAWHDVKMAAGIDGSPHPDVPQNVQDGIDWCGKESLKDTPENRAKGVVWLTFDDRAEPDQVRSLLATLKKYGVRGRFFPIGNWARTESGLIDQMKADGHFIGNHSADHAEFFRVKAVDRKAQTWQVADVPRGKIEQEISGGVSSGLIRFPFGAYDGRVLQIVSTMAGPDGQAIAPCGWTVDSLDWDHESTPTAASELKRIEAGMTPNAVVLMHMHGRYTPQILPALIEWLRANGYRTEAL